MPGVQLILSNGVVLRVATEPEAKETEAAREAGRQSPLLAVRPGFSVWAFGALIYVLVCSVIQGSPRRAYSPGRQKL